MCWDNSAQPAKPENAQRLLFPDLSEDEEKIVNILSNGEKIHINDLSVTTDIPVHRVNTLLFELEMKGIVQVLAGSLYQLV